MENRFVVAARRAVDAGSVARGCIGALALAVSWALGGSAGFGMDECALGGVRPVAVARSSSVPVAAGLAPRRSSCPRPARQGGAVGYGGGRYQGAVDAGSGGHMEAVPCWARERGALGAVGLRLRAQRFQIWPVDVGRGGLLLRICRCRPLNDALTLPSVPSAHSASADVRRHVNRRCAEGRRSRERKG